MKRFFLIFALSCLSLWIALPARAVEVHGLYQADVDVPDQTPAAREDALSTALREVLVKASGLSSIPDSPALASALQNASQYVRQFSYHTEERTPEAPTVAPDQNASGETAPDQGAPDQNAPNQTDGATVPTEPPKPVEQLVLTVRFDPAAVDKMLRDHQLPVWGTARPQMLIWLAVDQDGQRLMVSASDQGLARQVMEDEAKRRALPVILPQLDATDQQAIQPADIWGGFREVLRDASARYHPQAILSGRLQAGTDGKWEAHWLLMQGDMVAEWDNADADVEKVLNAGVDTATDAIASRMTENLNEAARRVVVEVDGVNNMDSFQKVNSYLRDLNGISGLRVEQVWPDRIRFSMEAPGGAEAVVQRIRLGTTLKPVEQPPQEGGGITENGPEGAVTEAPEATTTASAPSSVSPGQPAVQLAPRVIYCQLAG